jgi:hypothetical protein
VPSSVDDVPTLSDDLWLISWQVRICWSFISYEYQAWIRIAKQLTTPKQSSIIDGTVLINNTNDPAPTRSPLVFIPGPSHLTTLLHIFPPLFDRVKRRIRVDEIKYDGVLVLFKVSCGGC